MHNSREYNSITLSWNPQIKRRKQYNHIEMHIMYSSKMNFTENLFTKRYYLIHHNFFIVI